MIVFVLFSLQTMVICYEYDEKVKSLIVPIEGQNEKNTCRIDGDFFLI